MGIQCPFPVRTLYTLELFYLRRNRHTFVWVFGTFSRSIQAEQETRHLIDAHAAALPTR